MGSVRRVAALSLFSGCVSASGNAIAQHIDLRQRGDQRRHADSRTANGYDPIPTLRFFVYGAAFAPVLYCWHAFLNARFPLPPVANAAAAQPRASAGRAAVVLKRLAVDQAVFAPVACGAFVVGMGALEGLGPAEIQERMRAHYLRILLAGYAVWPAAQLVNLSVVPLAYRVQFGSVVSLAWNRHQRN
ncbi:hypothetical protein H4R18_003576 [Coemansia javaensis]|uniref:Protein SYM1 n=1 Tax=Coemansia javaensis TaxID=2761396 RepID=A0A9W8LID3_9FUNG|nr:hypothetical protein H4R18_003576 [Coemansia javaensis]